MGEYGLMQCVRPALLLRKPLEKGLSIASNVQKYGTGALNIDACRFGYGDPCWVGPNENDNYRPPHENKAVKDMRSDIQFNTSKKVINNWSPQGRWPANLYQCSDDDTSLLNTIDNTHEESNMTKDLWADMPSAKILHGDCMELLRSLPSNSIDAIVTDPPYGMSGDGIMRTWADLEEGHNVKGFMGKSWDSAVPCHNFFVECLRVIKHGGHMIAFSSTRTVCALGMAAQQGGWRVRDMLHWCYFSGFPKSHDISKAIDREAGAVREVTGQTTVCGSFKQDYQVKQGYRPNNGSDGYKGEREGALRRDKPATEDANRWDGFGTALKPAVEPALLLRKPLEKGLTIAQNVLKHGTGALNIDECRFGYGDPCWVGPQEEARSFVDRGREASGTSYNWANTDRKERVYDGARGRWPANLYQCAKASRSEREEGLDHLSKEVERGEYCLQSHNGEKRVHEPVKNFHPTVKPLKLMKWCCRLIGGQKGSTILDPFAGSGTTLMAGIHEGFDVVGMEMTDDYIPIIEGRVQWAKEQYKRDHAQLSLFGGEL